MLNKATTRLIVGNGSDPSLNLSRYDVSDRLFQSEIAGMTTAKADEYLALRVFEKIAFTFAIFCFIGAGFAFADEKRKQGWNVPHFSLWILLYRLATTIGCLLLLPVLAILPLHLGVSWAVQFCMPGTDDLRNAQRTDYIVQRYFMLFLRWEEICRNSLLRNPLDSEARTGRLAYAWKKVCKWVRKRATGVEEQGLPPTYNETLERTGPPPSHVPGIHAWEAIDV